MKMNQQAIALFAVTVTLGCGVLVALAQDSDGETRTWTDKTGNFKIDAKFIEFKDGKVHLLRDNGKKIAIEPSKLSREDAAFVRQLLKSRREQAKPPSNSRDSTNAATSAVKDWPQWRGPERDGICKETGLLAEWTGDGPPLAWQARGLGSGMSSVAVWDGRLYTLGHRGGKTELICLSADGGKELWSAHVGGGDPNGTPTVDAEAKLVFAVGRDGDLVCVRAETGEAIWSKNYGRDFGGKMMSGWGYSESPLVDGKYLICTPGANDALLAALDKNTGEVIWKTPAAGLGSRGKDGAAYSSIVVSNACGIKQYVQLVGHGVVGVEAETGRPLWSYDKIANTTANIPTPIVKGDFVFCSSGYDDGGTALLRLSKSGDRVAVNEVYYKGAKQMQNHHGGMVLLGDYVYMGHGHNNGFPVCVEVQTGKTVWGPGRGPGTGSAAIVYADGHLYFRYENAEMALIEATPKGYKLKGAFKLASRLGKSWPHPVISGGKLYLRDQDVLLCYDIRRK